MLTVVSFKYALMYSTFLYHSLSLTFISALRLVFIHRNGIRLIYSGQRSTANCLSGPPTSKRPLPQLS